MFLSAVLARMGSAVDVVSHPLHIPDGFLSLSVSLFFWLLPALFIGLALRATGKSLDERQVPLVGVLAAAIFAAQMLNFPVAGGTSGHMLGGALAGIVLGPWAGMLALTAVVAVQALIFQDGGLVVMGANIFDIGILPVLIGFGLYRVAAGRGRNMQMVVAGAAAWLSVMGAALVASMQIWLSGNAEASILFPAMMAVHAVIGVGEALLTVGALSFIMTARPDLLQPEAVQARGSARWIPVGLGLALGVTLLAPFASTRPDGLESVAEELGFMGLAQASPYAIMPDYVVPLLGQTTLSTVAAGIAGALLVFGLLYLIIGAFRKPCTARSEG